MSINELLVQNLFLLITALALFLTAAVVSYIAIYRKYQSLKMHLESDEKERMDAFTAKAEKEAQRIIKEAQAKAQLILHDASDIKEAFAGVENETRAAVLAEAKNDTGELLKRISDEITSEVHKEIGDFKTGLQAGVVKTSTNVNKELENYKEQKIKEMESVINSAISDVSLRLLGRSINPEEHRSIIIKVLEEAKRTHGF